MILEPYTVYFYSFYSARRGSKLRRTTTTALVQQEEKAMTTVSRETPLVGTGIDRKRLLREREWLVTNGLGGYASGTVGGTLTRRYHGLLIAAYPAPLGRIMVLTSLPETVRLADGSTIRLGADQTEGKAQELQGVDCLACFRLDDGLPVWRYQIEGIGIEKRVVLVHGQNTTHLMYRLVSGAEKVRLTLQPVLQFRPHDAPVNQRPEEPYQICAETNGYRISCGNSAPQLRLLIEGGTFTLEQKITAELSYAIEEARGYDSTGNLWSPGYFALDLVPGMDAVLTASTEAWGTISALSPAEAFANERERRRLLVAAADPKAHAGMPAELVLAADQFIIEPAGRKAESELARPAGEKICSLIAGYHWFTDWGRDTMISLEGLTLVTGRHSEAGLILRSFASYQKNGLIPNLFPEGKNEALYHTADASLWFIHAVGRYLKYTGDRDTLRLIMPQIREIVDRHLTGTSFGIGVDPEDGLLRQGAPGYQLTWMDAKVGDWVVTPRRGKAVEINALWYNALRLMAKWSAEEGDEAGAKSLGVWADLAFASFNERFWYREGGYLYDVVDGESGDDPSCRPNQIFAVSLPYPVLDPGRWGQVVGIVRERLLTRVGLRTLAPGHPDYKVTYHGDLRARDAAYHQGTVWPWLIGPFVDAWLRLYPEQKKAARGFLEGLAGELNEQCIGTVGEIYDAEAPHLPRGCVAQAWSVAELLRCWLKTDQEKSRTRI
jgi:predicted glycogen debranching enzyme